MMWRNKTDNFYFFEQDKTDKVNYKDNIKTRS